MGSSPDDARSNLSRLARARVGVGSHIHIDIHVGCAEFAASGAAVVRKGRKLLAHVGGEDGGRLAVEEAGDGEPEDDAVLVDGVRAVRELH